jgi:hypothetical protein
MKEKEERKALFLPAALYSRIDERAKATGFGSVEEYLVLVLQEVLKEEEGEEEQAVSKEDEEEVKKKLKALAYLEFKTS